MQRIQTIKSHEEEDKMEKTATKTSTNTSRAGGPYLVNIDFDDVELGGGA